MNKPGQPLHVTVTAELKEKIMTGVLNPGDGLPSENELAQQYNTSRVTIRKSLQALEVDGFIYSWHGKGYFVSEPSHDEFLICFSEDETGYETSFLSINAVLPSKEIADMLELSKSQAVIEIHRLIKNRGVPIAFDIKYIPHDKGMPTLEAEINYAVFPEIAASKTAPFAFHTEMEIGTKPSPPEVSAELGCEINTPLLTVCRLLIDKSGKRIGYGVKYMTTEYGVLKAKSGYDE